MTHSSDTSSKLDRPEILAAIFYPRHAPRTPPPAGAIDLDIPVGNDGTIISCRLYECDKEAPFILYFHGNGEIVYDYDQISRFYTKVGLNLFVATYRGYGCSGGNPCVSALYQDNTKILTSVINFRQQTGHGGALFVMGRSLGSASAIDLAYQFEDEFKGLIIESGFAETLPLALRLGYDISDADITEDDCFNNLPKIKKIELPTLILHGARDQLIPLAEAEKLQAESGARTKQFQVIPGADHNSLINCAGMSYFEAIKTFTDVVTGQNTWRQRRKKFKQQES